MSAQERSRHAIIVGCGGNIGSHLTPLIARLGLFPRITLIDPDTYEERNLGSQAIGRDALGRPKAEALAEALLRIDPALHVRPVVARVESVPLGNLRCDLLLSGPDSRAARLALSQIAFRLGIPWWIDAGVEASGSLVRVTVRAPSAESSCYACAFGPADYANLEVDYTCAPAPQATGAPSWLGALAASLQTAEAAAVFAGREAPAGGYQLVYDAHARTCTTTRLRRNPVCEFDHARWDIRPLVASPFTLTVEQALALAGAYGASTNGEDEARMGVPGQSFVRRLVCRSCGEGRDVLRLSRRLDPADRDCACGGERMPSGFDSFDALEPHTSVLASIGFRVGDVFTVNGHHFELGGSP